MPSANEMYDEAAQLKNAGDLPGAIAKLRELVALYPEDANAYSALAVYLQREGHFDEAIECAKKVCELKPDDAFSFTQLSVIYVKCGKIPEAEDARARAYMLQGGPGPR